MTPIQAQQVIDTLARGIAPETGEVLPADSPLNSPIVIRALFVAVRALELQAAASAPRPKVKVATPTDRPGNAGAGWSEEETRRLTAAFDAGRDLVQLAADHQRTVGAIRSRLIRLGRLQPGEDALPN